MTNTEILEEVYNRILTNRNADWDENDPAEEFRSLASFIELEWQSSDDSGSLFK